MVLWLDRFMKHARTHARAHTHTQECQTLVYWLYTRGFVDYVRQLLDTDSPNIACGPVSCCVYDAFEGLWVD